jgi:DNA-binding transcriptional LysR family regulator
MNFHQLNVFYEVAKARSFTAAAEKLYLTQPAVTLQIQNMEEYYKIKLFEHAGKQIFLTHAGEVLFEYAGKIFNLARMAEDAIGDFRRLGRGTLKIDSVFTFADYFLPFLLEVFYKKYPGITTHIQTGNTSQIIENTLLHRNDIAFVAYRPETDKLVAKEFVSDRLVGVVSPRHRFAQKESIALEELNGEPLILREEGSSPRKIVDEVLKTKGVSPQIVMESGSTSAIKKAVEAGMGMAILSHQAVKREIQDSIFKELYFSDAEITYQFFLIHHRDKYLSTLLKAFLGVATESALKLSTTKKEIPGAGDQTADNS